MVAARWQLADLEQVTNVLPLVVRSLEARTPKGEEKKRSGGRVAQLDGGAVGEHLGHALSELGGVVAHGQDGVGAALLVGLDHAGVGLGAGLFADLLVGADVAAQKLREGAADAL